ncbi:uncharacterized protein LOC110322727 [Mus pahari]|uniref:uncharacterized protein LOC110322727 n=1 Tax=Mus pahari TaxID=10093 RepID=UPI000A30409C|nr:uncharacterized protein LOC110322727 [Mus pahari]
MSGRQVNRSNAYNHLSQPNNVSFTPQTPGWAQYPNMSNGKGLRSRLPSSSELSTSSGHSEQSFNSTTSSGLPLGKICMGRPYTSKCVETSHTMKDPKVVKKPPCHHSSPHCLICTDHPSCPSSPTFLDQLIKGISYLDRSTNVYNNNSSYPKALSLPQLAATYLERAANSLYPDQPERPPPRSYSTPSTSTAAANHPNHPPANNCLVPSTRDTKSLQCLGGSTGLSYQQRPNNQTFNVETPQRPGVKLPEIPLFGNGFFSLGRLPKFWEAIRSGWNAPVPTPKSEGWW